MKAKSLLPTALLLISIISLTAISPLSNAQQTTALSIDPSSTQLTAAQVGTTINVKLTVSNVQNLSGWNLNLTWNPQVLNLTQIQEGSFLTNAGTTLFTWIPASSPVSRSQGYLQGVADVLLTNSGVSGNGVLATLSFKVISTGASPISIDGSTLINPPSNGVAKNIAITVINGFVNVGTSNISPTPTPISTTNPTTTSTTSSPSPSSQTRVTPPPTIPEFPVAIMTMLVLIASSACLIILKKNNKS